MPIEVTCRQCGKVYKVADQFAGRSAFCKSCGAQMQIPGSGAAADQGSYDVAADPIPQPVAAAPMPTMPAPGAVPQQPGAFFPRPPAVAAQPPRTAGFRLTKLSVFLLIIGGMMIFFGAQEWRLASVASATPQQITCTQLEKNGPGNNAYVTVTKFYNAPNLVYEKASANATEWRRAWVPIFGQDSDYAKKIMMDAFMGKINKSNIPPLTQINVLVKSNKIHNTADAQAMENRGQVTGMVINKIESLNQKEREKMQEMYPNADLSKTWIIEEGREPAQPSKYMGLMGGGGLLALIGLATMFKKA